MVLRIEFEEFVNKLIIEMTFESEVFELDLDGFEPVI